MAFSTEFEAEIDFRDDVVVSDTCFLKIFWKTFTFWNLGWEVWNKPKSGSKGKGLLSVSRGGQCSTGKKTELGGVSCCSGFITKPFLQGELMVF